MIKQSSFLFFIIILLFASSCVHTSRPFKESEPKEETTSLDSETDLPPPQPSKLVTQKEKKMADYCQLIQKYFDKHLWGKSNCENYSWNYVRDSVLGRPLIWKTFGEEKKDHNVTMIFCGVHGDEITPIKFCFDILAELTHNPINMTEQTIVVAPIVTPDSFLKETPTRTNANQVDINRNFPTRDWNKKALSTWANRYGRDPRRFPGPKALSEPETLFQVNLIKRYQPHKIISIHAPLTLLDYDGPRLGGKTTISIGEKLLKTISAKAYNYTIRNYPFFPGSLGNYAGNERHIPTYTLELPNSDPHRSQEFWDVFKVAIREAIETDFRAHEQESFSLTPTGSIRKNSPNNKASSPPAANK